MKDKLRQLRLPDKQKQRDFITSRPALQEILKEVFVAKTDRIKGRNGQFSNNH